MQSPSTAILRALKRATIARKAARSKDGPDIDAARYTAACEGSKKNRCCPDDGRAWRLRSRRTGTASAAVRERAPQCRGRCLTTWVPSPGAAGFAARHGYEHARFYWLMERPQHGSAPQVDWPPGVEVETFDGTERALGHWS